MSAQSSSYIYKQHIYFVNYVSYSLMTYFASLEWLRCDDLHSVLVISGSLLQLILSTLKYFKELCCSIIIATLTDLYAGDSVYL